MKPPPVYCILFLLLHTSLARADVIRYTITTDSDTYVTGDTVDWSVVLEVTESSASNFGLESAALNLRDSLGETLTPGTINFGGFPGYFPFGGEFDNSDQTLKEMVVALSFQSGAVLQHVSDSELPPPIQFASGSFVATQVGSHTLQGSEGRVNAHFSAANVVAGTGPLYDVTFRNAAFSVSAVPEPSAIGMLSVASVLLGIRRRRSNRKPNRA